jgi:hypothetical protein
LQNGLNIGVPYSIPDYPAALNPATDGCRNITGRVNPDGTVTIFAVTSTVSASGDQGADPNKLVRVTDSLKATTLRVATEDHDHDSLGHFTTIRWAKSGEVLRGIAFAELPSRPAFSAATTITRSQPRFPQSPSEAANRRVRLFYIKA